MKNTLVFFAFVLVAIVLILNAAAFLFSGRKRR